MIRQFNTKLTYSRPGKQVCGPLSPFGPTHSSTFNMETAPVKTNEQLDIEFDRLLVDMKPYVMKFPDKTDRQRCAVWIKKLCEPISGLSNRKTRNQYAQVMLKMLRRGSLQSPFDHKPESGNLSSLPSYMDDLHIEDLKTSYSSSALDTARRTLPTLSYDSTPAAVSIFPSYLDELSIETGKTETTSSFDRWNRLTGASYATDEPFSLRASEMETRIKLVEAKFYEEKVEQQRKHDKYVQDIIDRKNSEMENLKSEYNSKVNELEEVVSRLDNKVIKGLQSKHQEEKMELQRKHDDYIQKIIDRKNNEIEEIKSQYNSKVNDMEEVVTKLDNKLKSLSWELDSARETKDKQIADLKKRLEDTETLKTRQYDKNSKLVQDLEDRIDGLRSEADNAQIRRATLEKDKNELQMKVDRLEANLEDVRDRYDQLDHEYKNTLDIHQQEKQNWKNKSEANAMFLKQENSLASTQVRSLKLDLEQLEQDSGKKIKRLEQKLEDKEEEISRLKEQNHSQAAQADKALEEFKLQVKKNQTQIYDEMKEQMDRVQSDLHKSKQSREKQAQEFSRQLEDERFQHDAELAELKVVFDNDKSQLLKDFHNQKEYILSQHEKDLDDVKAAHQMEISCMETKMRERREKDEKMIRDLEIQLRELREELVQSNQLRKQQLVELGLLREEEKQKMLRDHEAAICKMRTDGEQQRLELQKTHSLEMEDLLQKTNSRFKDMERDNAEKMNKSAETINGLHGFIDNLQEEMKSIKEKADVKLAETKKRLEEDFKSLEKQCSSGLTKMKQELESKKKKIRSLERELQKREADHEEQTTELKLGYEERIRGLISVEVKRELEDTIDALRSQVNSLQQRASVLQEELDAKHSH